MHTYCNSNLPTLKIYVC